MLIQEVTLSRTEQFAALVVDTLNSLHENYCCPYCCQRCMILADLLTAGELDEIVVQAPRHVPRNPVWQVTGAQGKRVNRTWLYARWNPDLNQCPCSYLPEDQDTEKESVRPPTRARNRLGPRTAKTKACEVHRQAKQRCTCQPASAVI
jgi:hypothetical protein